MAYAAGDFATALERYQAAVQKNPQDAESLSNLGQVLVRLNRTPEAIAYFDRAVAILPNRWAYQFNLARALGLLGRTDEAIAGYRRAQCFKRVVCRHRRWRRIYGATLSRGCFTPCSSRFKSFTTRLARVSGFFASRIIRP